MKSIQGVQARHRPRTTLGLYPGIPQHLISTGQTWLQNRHDAPLGNGKAIENQMMLIEGPPCSGKSTYAEVLLNEQGYQILKFNPADKPELKKIYDAAISLTNVSSALKRKRIAIILEDIHQWSKFPFGELAKLLTFHKPSVAKSIRAQLIATGKIVDKDANKRRKYTPRRKDVDIKGDGEDTELKLSDSDTDDDEPSDDAEDDQWMIMQRERIRNSASRHEAAELAEAVEANLTSEMDEVQGVPGVPEAQGARKRKSTPKMKLNCYGIGGNYNSPIVCPIIATCVPSYLDTEQKTKVRRDALKNLGLRCKRIKLDGFTVEKLRIILRNVCEKEKIGLSLLEQASLIEFAKRDLKQIFDRLQWGGSPIPLLQDPCVAKGAAGGAAGGGSRAGGAGVVGSAGVAGVAGSGGGGAGFNLDKGSAFDCVDHILQNSHQMNLQQCFDVVDRHSGLPSLIVARYLDGVKVNTLGEVAGFLQMVSNNDCHHGAGTSMSTGGGGWNSSVDQKIFLSDIVRHNRGWQAPGWSNHGKVNSIGKNMGAMSRCYDRERMRNASFTGLFESLGLKHWMMSSSLPNKFHCIDVLAACNDRLPADSPDVGKLKMIRNAAFKVEPIPTPPPSSSVLEKKTQEDAKLKPKVKVEKKTQANTNTQLKRGARGAQPPKVEKIPTKAKAKKGSR